MTKHIQSFRVTPLRVHGDKEFRIELDKLVQPYFNGDRTARELHESIQQIHPGTTMGQIKSAIDRIR